MQFHKSNSRLKTKDCNVYNKSNDKKINKKYFLHHFIYTTLGREILYCTNTKPIKMLFSFACGIHAYKKIKSTHCIKEHLTFNLIKTIN